jgi:hypothetical protein
VICYTKVRINIEIPNKTGIYIKKYPVVIIEGRKEDVAKRLKQRFEYDSSFIDRMISVDPTGYKYVDYIGKQLEKLIPQLAGQKGGLNVTQQDAIKDVLSMVIPWFHSNVNRITEDDIWKAETIFRERNGMVPNIEGIAKSFKDIAQYENPEFIRTLMEIVDSKKTEREKERELKTQAERLYEDDDVLVIRPKSHAASCYYGANTKWCTTTAGSSGYFEKYIKSGLLYYFINKKENTKMALYRNTEERKTEVYNAQDKLVSLEDLREQFPNQNDLIDELIGSGEFIKALRNFSKGKIDYRELEDSDESILKVKPSDPPGQSTIVINFDEDEKFFKALDISEDDLWFLNAINSHYNSYDFMDSYQIEQDFKEGYVIYGELNEENNKKLKEIAELILPEEEFNMDNDDYRIKLSETLLSLFDSEMDWILGDYHTEKNSEMLETARTSIEKEINGFLESIGFIVYREYDEIATTPANLLMWSARLQLPKIDAISLFNQIIEYSGTGKLGGWSENSYEYQDYDNFDSNAFNNTVERQFDKILEKLDEDEDAGGEKIKEFLGFRNRIVKKFGINKWNKLPIDKNVGFKVENFDRENMRVIIMIEKQYKGMRRLKLSEENFNNLLYSPQLFDLFEV